MGLPGQRGSGFVDGTCVCFEVSRVNFDCNIGLFAVGAVMAPAVFCWSECFCAGWIVAGDVVCAMGGSAAFCGSAGGGEIGRVALAASVWEIARTTIGPPIQEFRGESVTGQRNPGLRPPDPIRLEEDNS